jgi:VWFA-related protein
LTRCLLLLCLLPALVLAEEAPDATTATYRSTVSEVSVTFFATDENNHPLSALQTEDFAVVDDGTVVRQFRSLTRSDETALDVVVAVDASESVTPRFQTAMNAVLRLVSQTDLANDDSISVLSFAGLQPSVICAGDCRAPAAGEKLRALTAAGPTPLFDTLAYGADFISSHHTQSARPVLVLFSDGDDSISKASFRDALQAITAGGTLLYAVDVSQPGSRSRGSLVLQQLAGATGGRYFSLGDGSANVLQAALDDLRASYVVTYSLPNPAVGFHSLRILPKHNLSLRFHCRSGYYYGTSIP